MLKKPDPKTKPLEDEITQKLRAAARKRRPLNWWGLLVLLGLLLIPAGLVVWWVYPKPDPPRLDVVAVDQLGLAGQEVELRAFLEPLDTDPAKLNLEGYSLFFEEKQFPGKAKPGKVKETTSLPDGWATVSWIFPRGQDKNSFIVRLPGDKMRRGKMDVGQVFFCQVDTPLLLVDVKATLSSASAADWEKKNPLDIKPVADAAKALQGARKKKFQVVYLALASDRALAYRKVRGWVVNNRSLFPEGPVLGRKSYPSEESNARHEILRSLKETFRGPLVAVVGQEEAAAVCGAMGVHTILIGIDGGPKEVVRVKSWREVPEKLPKK